MTIDYDFTKRPRCPECKQLKGAEEKLTKARAKIWEMRTYLAGDGPLTDEMKAYWWADAMDGLDDNPPTDT